VILLARHGETDWNRPPARVQGSFDVALNDEGRDQARALAECARGRGITALYTSHLRRARETAQVVGATLGLEPDADERLAESFRGEWQGRLIEDIEREDPERWSAWLRAGPGFRFPGGEALTEHCDRVAAALDRVASGPQPALVICHGGTIRCALARAHPRGLDAYHEAEVPNGALLRVPAPAETASG
jgi:2,3-bisphosphoglycerate-dependent phosphoglycerate mutase